MRAVGVPIYFITVLVILTVISLRLPTVHAERDPKNRDIFYIYGDSSTLAEGKNPYARIAGKNLLDNEKYTFYLPGFLVAAAGLISLSGIESYDDWMRVWIPLSVFFHFLVGLVLYLYCVKRWGLYFAIIGSAFWWFSRWPLALLRSGQIDSVAILFFLLALLCFEKKRLSSLVFLGLSLVTKQIAIFTVPLFLGFYSLRILDKQSDKQGDKQEGNQQEMKADICSIQGVQQLVIKALPSLIYLLGIPILISLPFFLWDPQSFFRMLLFPLTREPLGPRSIEYFIGLEGFAGKLPYLLLLISSYVFCLKERAPFFCSLLFAMVLFVSFNAVFFSRYFCWVVPLLPLAIFECLEKKSTQ